MLALSIAAPHASAGGQPPRPPDTVFLEELTWTELRELQRAGKTTVIIATAGTEQKGPHMVTGEHKYVITHAMEQVARQLGFRLIDHKLELYGICVKGDCAKRAR